jgi:hypothetical protein
VDVRDVQELHLTGVVLGLLEPLPRELVAQGSVEPAGIVNLAGGVCSG